MTDPHPDNREWTLLRMRLWRERRERLILRAFYLFSILLLAVMLTLVLVGCASRSELLPQQRNNFEVSVSAPMQENRLRRRLISLHLGGPTMQLQINLQDDRDPLSSGIFEEPPTQK